MGQIKASEWTNWSCQNRLQFRLQKGHYTRSTNDAKGVWYRDSLSCDEVVRASKWVEANVAGLGAEAQRVAQELDGLLGLVPSRRGVRILLRKTICSYRFQALHPMPMATVSPLMKLRYDESASTCDLVANPYHRAPPGHGNHAIPRGA